MENDRNAHIKRVFRTREDMQGTLNIEENLKEAALMALLEKVQNRQVQHTEETQLILDGLGIKEKPGTGFKR